MADKRLRTKSEVKRFFTNLKGKPITDDMISILIDVLWRNRSNMRTSGFRLSGGPDAVISFDIPSRTFSIAPYDPLEPTYSPRFTFYSWSYQADFNEKRSDETIQIPNEEGLFAIFYATNETTREQSLHYIKNPTETELTTIYLRKIVISFIYWDATAGEVVHFGDDRHGSEWNPQLHTYLHDAFRAKRKNGLQFAGMLLDGDGSDNAHAQFNITGGIMLHDDFQLTIPGSSTSIPILYSFGSLPRFLSNAGYGVAKGPNRIYFNSGQISLAECASGNYCLYHIFSTNEILTTSRKTISVMGIAEYTTLADAYANVNFELDSVFTYMPQQGACYIGSIIVQTDDTYTNSIKARIVSIVAKETHPPVSIAPGSEIYLSINDKQELAFDPDSLPGGGTGEDGREVEFSTSGGYVVWRYVGDPIWTELFPIPIDGDDGVSPHIGINGNWYVGATDTGIKATGIDGNDGDDGREVEFRENAGWVEWRYVGVATWTQLYEIPTSTDTAIKVAIDFVDAGALEFVYNCPVALVFTSQDSEGADATISPVLNTNMSQYGKVTITAPGVGLIVLNGNTL